MTSYNISSRSTGLEFGTYQGETVAEALEAWAKDAQYASYADLCEALGKSEDEATDDLRVTEAV